MRMEVTDFIAVLFNPVAQAKFVHTVSAPATSIGVDVRARRSAPGICCAGGTCELAKRSMTVAASFGLAASLSVVVLGDESGYTVDREPEDEDRRRSRRCGRPSPRPAAFTAFGIPDQETRETHYAIQIPWVMGLIATRSLDHRDPRHRRTGRTGPRRASATASSPTTRCRRSAPPAASRCPEAARDDLRGAMATTWATRCCSSATSTIRGSATPSRSPKAALRHRAGGAAAVLVASASWSGSACSSSLLFGHLLRAVGAAPARCASAGCSRWRCSRMPLPWIAVELRLDRGRGRPPALGDRGRAADRAGGVEPRRQHGAVSRIAGFIADLHRAAA